MQDHCQGRSRIVLVMTLMKTRLTVAVAVDAAARHGVDGAGAPHRPRVVLQGRFFILCSYKGVDGGVESPSPIANKNTDFV